MQLYIHKFSICDLCMYKYLRLAFIYVNIFSLYFDVYVFIAYIAMYTYWKVYNWAKREAADTVWSTQRARAYTQYIIN